jgi:D-glycero-alpha-D-manno-heptose 1-phosphate guanylyltransferase
MKTKEAIVLAGGLGTRLRSAVSDVPKPMAPIAGRPFLEFVLTQLRQQGLERVILSVGYKSEVISAHFGTAWNGLALDYCIEDRPLGTGGAIAEAFKLLGEERALVLNGDTVLDETFSRLETCHLENGADLTLFAREIEDGGRYGVCELDGSRIRGFASGEPGKPGCINAGSYLIEARVLQSPLPPAPFSFESEILPNLAKTGRTFAVSTRAKFIDIGVPESYHLAQSFIPAIGI